MTPPHHRHRHPWYREKYKVTKWLAYKCSLVRRGDFTCYYRQSAVENMFYRYKILIGDQLRARGENSRQVESVLACNILNQFRLLGRPESEVVA